MVKTSFLFLAALLIFTFDGWASSAIRHNSGAKSAIDTSFYKRTYVTSRLEGAAPTIDGKLVDACWNNENWSQEYVQQTPSEGAKASQRTKLKIVFDDKNIYVAFKCYDAEPQKIHNYTGRRDEIIGDVVGINFDSYYDHRFGYEFNITAGGSKIDLLLKNNGEPDVNWNAVWYGKTAIDDSSWTAEMQIPLSQLRYNDKPDQIWGMHSWRWIDRNMEEDQWSLIPRNNTGFIYNFGELKGIKNLPKSHRIEFLPYTLGGVSRIPNETGNPFTKGYQLQGTAGLDGKVGIGSDFTIDYTINPDFGQVEADPSVMNLSAFETFYDEKRPFFLEGKNVMDYNLESDELFYSRRIGHAPSVVPASDAATGKFVSFPENTTILNAVKFTGKTSNGFSVGVMQSTTNEEYSLIDLAGIRKNIISEPFTNYFLMRTQQDFNSGNTIIGAIVSSTNRNINNSILTELNKNAYSGGIDLLHYWNKRNYYASLNFIGSRIEGSQQAMLKAQNSAVHYFQRTDANYLRVDSGRTSMSGNGGIFTIGKEGTGNLKIEEKVSWRSPGLELNDIGFLQRADYVKQQINVNYHESKPNNIFREFKIKLENINQWNYGGLNEKNSTLLVTFGQFKNKWGLATWVYRAHSTNDTRELRGGPAIKIFPYWHIGSELNTDWSKPVSVTLQVSTSFANTSKSYDYEMNPGLGLKISPRFYVNTELNCKVNSYRLVYAGTDEKPSGNTYFMAHIFQKTYGLTFRFNININPELSVQYYGSPFVSQGKYDEFKLITNPQANSYASRFEYITATELLLDKPHNNYVINHNSKAYTIGNPDFNSREFRSNFVLRWEYKTGSVLYFVWSHQRATDTAPYDISVNDSFTSLVNSKPYNTMMLKFNYYFNI